MGPTGCGRQVVVANQEKSGDAAGGQSAQPTREFPLVGLRRIAPLVRVSGQQHEVHGVGQGVFNQFVESLQEVGEARGQAGIGIGTPVVFDADVEVGEMQYAHDESNYTQARAVARTGERFSQGVSMIGPNRVEGMARAPGRGGPSRGVRGSGRSQSRGAG